MWAFSLSTPRSHWLLLQLGVCKGRVFSLWPLQSIGSVIMKAWLLQICLLRALLSSASGWWSHCMSLFQGNCPWATGIPSSGLNPRPTKQPGPRSPTIAYLYHHARGLNAVARSSALSPEVTESLCQVLNRLTSLPGCCLPRRRCVLSTIDSAELSLKATLCPTDPSSSSTC